VVIYIMCMDNVHWEYVLILRWIMSNKVDLDF
jgi:hypothetical protein